MIRIGRLEIWYDSIGGPAYSIEVSMCKCRLFSFWRFGFTWLSKECMGSNIEKGDKNGTT
jgi:hypothetical protein